MKSKSNLIKALMLTVIVVLLAGFSSAALQLSSSNVPSNVSHNQGTIPVTFILANTGTAQTGLEWTGTSNIGTWTNLASLPTTINAGATITISVVLTIPKNKAGTIQANLDVESNEAESDSRSISMSIAKSATLSLTKTQELTSSQNGIVSITNTGNAQLSNIELTASGSLPVTFSSNNVNLAPGSSLSVNVISSNLTDLDFGSNSVTVSAKDLNENVLSNTVVFSVSSGFCSAGEKGDLQINDVSIESDGDDEDVWKPLDEITIEVEVENDGDDEIQDIVVEMGLFDSNGRDVADDLDFSNEDEEKIDLGDLDDGDDEMVTFTFVVPADLEERGDYKLAIKVYSEDDGEELQCSDRASDFSDDSFQDIEIESEDDEGKFIAFENIELQPSEAVCGDTVNLNVDVFNLGEDEQDQVKVTLFNSKLGLNLEREIRVDLDEGDSEQVEFEFLVPETATDGSYTLELSSEYDYRSGNYRESSDEDTGIIFKVIGCTPNGNGNEDDEITINAVLESDAMAGEELVVRATITNTGDAADFVVTASGFEAWATLDSISERLVNIGKGQSKDITMTFNVDADAEGENSFVVEVRSGSKLETREISVNIDEAESSGGFSFDFENNALIWVIGIINVVLIVLIIVVATRISRK